MAKQSTVLAAVKKAVNSRSTEGAQLSAVVKTLAQYGTVREPAKRKATIGRGTTVRIYVFEDSAAGDFVLITGPSIQAEIRTMAELSTEKAPKGFYVETVDAGTRADKLATRAVARGRAEGKRASKPTAATVRKPLGGSRKAKSKPAPPPRPRGRTVKRSSRASGRKAGSFTRASGYSRPAPKSKATMSDLDLIKAAIADIAKSYGV